MGEYAIRRRTQNRQQPKKVSSAPTQWCKVIQPKKMHYLCRFSLYAIAVVISFIAAAVIHYYCFDGPIKSVKYRLPKPQEFRGALEPNKQLTHAEILLLEQIYGPESITIHRKSKIMYAGLKTGHIVEIKFDSLKNEAKLMKGFKLVGTTENEMKCDGSYDSFPKCGRPRGLRFQHNNDDLLLVADAYHGLYEVNTRNAMVRSVLKAGTQITRDPSSRPITYFNDFDISKNGRHIVLSESSQRFSDRDFLYSLVEHRPDGRLLHYDVHKEELKELVTDLQHPSGVQFDSTEKCVLFSEMGNLRILRHCFNYGYGNYMIVANNLPGYPVNIRTSRNGMLWVPIGKARLKEDTWFTEKPWLRDLLAMIVSPQSFSMLIDYLSPKYGLLLLIDPTNGSILRSFHDPTGTTITSITQVAELEDGTVLIGNGQNRFLAMFKPVPAL